MTRSRPIRRELDSSFGSLLRLDGSTGIELSNRTIMQTRKKRLITCPHSGWVRTE